MATDWRNRQQVATAVAVPYGEVVPMMQVQRKFSMVLDVCKFSKLLLFVILTGTGEWFLSFKKLSE